MWSRDKKLLKVCKVIVIISHYHHQNVVEGQKGDESLQVDNYHYSSHHYHYHYNNVVQGQKKINVNKVMVSENVIIPTVNLDDYELMIVSKYRYHIKHFRTNDCHLWRL